MMIGSLIKVEINKSPKAARSVCELPPELTDMGEYYRAVVGGFFDEGLEYPDEEFVRKRE